MKSFIVLSSTLLLTACGLGLTKAPPENEAGTDNPPVHQAVTPTAEATLLPTVQATSTPVDNDPNSTASLVVPEGFEFVEQFELQLVVENDKGEEGYLSLCSDFFDYRGEIEVNYDNCLRQKVETSFKKEVIVGNDITELVMVLWYFDPDKKPLKIKWQRTPEGVFLVTL